MSTTFTAIHVLKNGVELKAEFTISDKCRQDVRRKADVSLQWKHRKRCRAAGFPVRNLHAHCWQLPAKEGTDFFQYVEKQWVPVTSGTAS